MRHTIWLAVSTVFFPLCAAAATDPTAPSQETFGRPFTLTGAVEQTLRHDPEVQRALETAAERQAVLIETSGLFDPVVLLDSRFSFESRELFGDRLREEKGRRLRPALAARHLEAAADEIQTRLATADLAGTFFFFDECLPGQTIDIVELENDQEVLLCINSSGELDGVILPDDTAALQEIFDDLSEDLKNIFIDQLRRLNSQLRLAASTFNLQHEQLGATPREEEFLNLEVSLAHQLRLRNGMGLVTSLQLAGDEDNFAGKPLRPELGDSLVPNTFTTAFGLRLEMPLGKGRGRVATAAPEMAAEADWQAAVEGVWHVASERALAAIVAYWRAAAAADRLRWLEASAATYGKIVETVDQLVDGDELIPIELERAKAQRAQTLAELAVGREQAVRARIELAATMGLAPRRFEEIPLTAEGLPQELVSAAIYADAVAGEIAELRHDLRALREQRRASEILARAAKANLRHQVDLSLNASMTGLYETFEERVYEPAGFWRAFSGEVAGPSYGIALRWVLPFGNHRARGRLLQAESSLVRSQIDEAELERQIGLRTIELEAQLAHGRDELIQLQATVTELETTRGAMIERLHDSDVSVLDTLLTERQLTDSRLAEVDLRRRLAELEAELRFETGGLLERPERHAELDVAGSRLVLLSLPATPSAH